MVLDEQQKLDIVREATPNGTAYFYEAAILALPMPDGKHYITRMD